MQTVAIGHTYEALNGPADGLWFDLPAGVQTLAYRSGSVWWAYLVQPTDVGRCLVFQGRIGQPA